MFLTLPAEDGASNAVEQRRCIHRALETLLKEKDVFPVLFSHLDGPLERYESSQLRLREDDGKTIQLFLTLVRNLLLGAEKQGGRRGEGGDESQLRENLLKIFFELRVTDMLVQMAKVRAFPDRMGKQSHLHDVSTVPSQTRPLLFFASLFLLGTMFFASR